MPNIYVHRSNLGSVQGRPVCIPSEQTTEQNLQLASRSRSRSDRCISATLGTEVMLCFPSVYDDSEGNIPGEETGSGTSDSDLEIPGVVPS